jgi:hypothetical protein
MAKSVIHLLFLISLRLRILPIIV